MLSLMAQRRHRHAARVILLLAALIFACHAASADAYTETLTAQQLEDVLQWVERGHGADGGGRTLTCGTVCSNVWLEEHRPMPNQPTSRALHAELSRLRVKTGLVRLFTSSFAPIAAIAAAPFIIRQGRNMFGISRADPTFNPDTMDWKLARATVGTTIQYGANHPDGPFPYTYPENGFRVTYQNGTGLEIITDPDCWNDPGEFVPSYPMGVEIASPEYNNCARPLPYPPWQDEGGLGVQKFAWVPGSDAIAADFPVQSYDGRTPDRTVISLPPPTRAEVEAGVKNQLDNNAEDYPVTEQFLCAQMAQGCEDPRNILTMPDCTGMSYNACVTALQDAGFGVHHRETLSFADAIPMPQGQAHQVKRTVPAAGQAVASDTDIAVEANPAQEDMPFLMPSLGGKTQQEALDALAPFGVTAPGFEVLPEGAPNLDYGPDVVAGQQPAAGSRTQYGSPEVELQKNPTSAPVPGAGAGYTCGLVPPPAAFDLSPVTDAELADKMPFAFAGFMANATSGLALGSERPNAEFYAFGETADLGFLANFDPVVTVFRTAVAFLLWLGAAWSLYGWTIGRNV